MKNIVHYLFFLIMLFLMLHSCVTEKNTYIPTANKELFGTWINTDEKGIPLSEQKKVNYPDGTWKFYPKVTDTEEHCKGPSTITDMWIDSEGAIWYTSIWECFHGMRGYEIGKISDSGNTWEYIVSYTRELTSEDWQPDDLKNDYHIYYRQ